MVLRWLLRLAMVAAVFAAFAVLDRTLGAGGGGQDLVRGVEIGALAVLGAAMAATGAAAGAGRIDVEGRAMDWLLHAQIVVLFCLVFRLLGDTVDNRLLRALASLAIASIGAAAAGIAGSVLFARLVRGGRTP